MTDSLLNTSIANLRTELLAAIPTATASELMNIARSAKGLGLSEDTSIETAINSRANTLTNTATSEDIIKISGAVKQMLTPAGASGGGGGGSVDLTAVSTNIIPDTDITYDLGSTTHKFKDLYLDGSTLNLGNQTIKATATGIEVPELKIGTGTNTVKLTVASDGKLTTTETDSSGNTSSPAAAGGGSSVTVSDTAPTSPSAGDQWFDSSSLIMFVYYADGSSSQWVPATPAGQTGATGADGAAGSAGSNPTPTITSVTPASYTGVDATTFSIAGTNFTVGTVVDFITVGGAVHRATTTTVVDQANLTCVTPQAFVEADGPLDVKVTVSGGANVTTTDAIQTGGSPVWTTAAGTLSAGVGPLGASDYAYRLEETVTEQITATDPEGQTVSYQISSGALPTGVTLAGNTGAITGTTAATLSGDTTYSFTGLATDTSGNGTPRVFNIIVKNETGVLYQGFTDVYTQANSSYFTFHPCGRTGPLGPTLNPAQHAYGYQSTNTWVANSSYFNINDGDGSTAGGLNTAGVQIWTCPQTGTYKINMAGACGSGSRYGSSWALGGRGAIMTGTVNLTVNQKYAIVAGQIGGLADTAHATDGSNIFSNGVTGSGAAAVWTNNIVTGSDYTNSNVKWNTTPNNRSTQQLYDLTDSLFTTGGGASFIAEWDDSTGIGSPIMVAGGGGSLRNGSGVSGHSSLSAARTYDYTTFDYNQEINTILENAALDSYKSYNAVGWDVTRAGDGSDGSNQTAGGSQSLGEGGGESSGAYADSQGGAGWNTGTILASGLTLPTAEPIPYLTEALKNGGRGGVTKGNSYWWATGGFGGGGAGGWGGSGAGGGYAGGGEAGNTGGIGGGGSSYKNSNVTLSNVGLGDSGNHHEGFVQVQFVS